MTLTTWHTHNLGGFTSKIRGIFHIFVSYLLTGTYTDMKKLLIILAIASAAMTACEEKYTVNPAISFFSRKPEMKGDTAVFRIATLFFTSDNPVTVPVTFGGTAVKGTDFKVSSESFIIGGEEPLDSIEVYTLIPDSGKDLTLSLVCPEGFDLGKYATSGYDL